MAETQPPPVATPSSGPEALPYDDALLIKVKGKAKRPTKPDDTERNLQVQKLQAEINRYSDRIKEIKEIIENKRNNAKGVGSGSKDARQKLAVLREERGTVLRQKQAIRDELNSCNAKRESIRSEMRSVKEKTRVMDPAELETKIRELEFKLEHETVSEQEEKRIQQTLQQLNTSRPLVRQYAALDARLKESEAERASIIKRLQDLDAVLASIQARLDAEQAAIDEIRNKEQDEIVDVPALNVEKKEAYDIMVALRQKIQEIRAAFDEKYTEYIKLDKNYNAWFRHQRRLKAEERQKEREERDAEYQATQAEASGIAHAEPYDAEIFTIDQLLVYLGSFSDKKEEESKAQAKVVEAPSGMKSFKRKDDDFALYGGVTRKAKPAPTRGPGSSAAAAASAPAAEKPAEKKAQKLNHSLETLKTFLTLGIDVPQTTTEIAATVDKVKAKREHFLELRKKAKEAPPPRAANGHSVGASGSGSKGADAEEELLADHSEEDPELEAEEEAAADAGHPTDDAEGTAAVEEVEETSTAEVAEEAAGAAADATADLADAIAEAVEAFAADKEEAKEAGTAKEEPAAKEESTAEDVEEVAAAVEEVAEAAAAEVEPETPAAAPEANGGSPAKEQHASAPALKDEVGMKLSVDDSELVSVALSVA